MHPEKHTEQIMLALDLARIGFYDWNVKEDAITFSKHMLNDWGIDSPESTTLEVAISRIHPDDQERVRDLVNEAMREHKKYQTEYRVVRPDGEIVWVEVNGVIEYDSQDHPVRFFGTSLNITERKHKEKVLEENERMIRTFLDTMPQMSFIADGEGNILHFNQRWYEYVRFEGAEGQGWRERPVHHPDDFQRTVETWEASVRSGRPYEIAYRLRRHDGEYRWHLGRAFPVRDKHGIVRRWYGTNTDIHEERTTVERNEILYSLGVKLSEGLGSTGVASMILDEGKRILKSSGGIVLVRDCNSFRIVAKDGVEDRFVNMLNLDSPELRMPARVALYSGESVFISGQDYLRREFPDFAPFMEVNGIKSVIALPLTSKGLSVASVAFYLKEEMSFPADLIRFLELMASQCGIAIDRAFLLEDQEVQKSKLREAVIARDEFFSIASHELKTPLTSLRLNGQLLRKKAKMNEGLLDQKMLSDFLDSNDRSVLKLVRLVDDMLDISRIKTGRITISREEFDLEELAFEAIERARGTTSVKIEYQRGSPLTGNWDRLRIEQVFSNLLSNALRYGEKKPVHVHLETRAGEVIFRVKDQGVGIPKDLHSTIFERYERGHAKDIQGLGLGLYISRHIIDAHGGRIWVESIPGLGSEFFVALPV